MLRPRVVSALILGPLALAGAFLGGLPYFALVAAVAVLALREYWGLASQMGYRPDRPLALGILALSLIQARGHISLEAWGGGLSLLLLLSLALQLRFPPLPDAGMRRDPVVDWALGLGGGLYIGWLSGHFVSLRELPSGFQWTLLAFLTTWAHDSGAYLAGRAIGKRPLAFGISPHKTWEGTLAGWVVGSAVAAGAALYLGRPDWEALGLGIVLSLAATAGDLVESFLKRRAGAKDSGHLIPGHGGILDRIDSLLFVVVAVYYYVIWMVGD